MKTYPVALIGLEHRQAVVIGGGEVATRKVAGLLEAGARVSVISPELTPELEGLAAAGQIQGIRRPYREGDLADAFLVIAATDDPAVNQAVWEEATRRGCLVNVADDPAHSNFIVPATVRRGELVVAVSTGGASPALARRLRERLADFIGPEYGALAGLLAELRPQLIARFPPGKPRAEAALRLVDSDLLDILRDGGLPAAREHAQGLLERLAGSQPTDAQGMVYLVGAGPGDPGLITVRGLECLRAADVVVYDRLANPTLLRHARPDAELVDVGKQPEQHPVTQEQINALLVEKGKAGKVVVRLKGGDPFVFGRGGEEALALAAAGVPFEIVPGVTSAIAAPAWAGIPVTHRELAGGVAIVTGHRADAAASGEADWERLARFPGTLVFLMGVANLERIVAALLAGGRSGETPVAVIANGTLPDQETVVGSLADIADRVAAANVRPPAVIVVGEVVRLRDHLRWGREVVADSARKDG